MQSNVVQRNFLRLLRAGLFGSYEPAEPMSAWKWNHLFHLALMHGVGAEVLRGVELGTDDFFLRLPPSQTAKWRKMAGEVEPAEDGPQMRTLSNGMLARRLQKIVAEETADGQVTPTLRLLLLSVRAIRHLMSDGICLRQLSDMALLLRANSQAIDTKRLRAMLDRLQMRYIANLEGSMLVDMLGMDEREVPLLRGRTSQLSEAVCRDIFTLKSKDTGEWHFTETGRVFVTTSNRRAMMWHLRHGATFIKYCPAEAVSCLAKGLANSLGQIEE